MNTHTSKKKIWLRSLVLLPVLALLFFSFSTTVQQNKATPQQVTEYNSLAKKYNTQPKKGMLVKLKEVNRIEYLYKLMTSSQKKKAEKLPSFPPMPPSPKVIKGVNDKESNIPPPPAPPKMPKNADYILDNKKVSYDVASKVKNDRIESVDIADKDGDGNKLEKPVIYIYTKKEKKIVDESDSVIAKINGVTCNECTVELTKTELVQMMLTAENDGVTSFKVKFPKNPTQSIKGNVLTLEAKKMVVRASLGQLVQIFDIKTSENNTSPYIMVKIVKKY